MRNAFALPILTAVVITGCMVQPNPYVEYYNRGTNFIKAADIKAGEKLQKQHPNEEFVIEDYTMEVDFTKNKEYEEWAKAQNARKKMYKKLKWSKNNRSYTVDLDDEFTEAEIKKIKTEYENRYSNGRGIVNGDDFQDYVDELIKERNSAPPGKYMSLEKHSYLVTSLSDFSDYNVSLGYSSGQKIKNFKFDYGRGAFEPDYIVKNYESNGIFHNDAKMFYTSTEMPTIGSKVYVDYEHEYPDMTYNTVVYIPEEHFTERKVVTFAIPAWLDVTIVEKNLEGVSFTKSSAAPKKLKKKMLPNVVSDNSTSTAGTTSKKSTKTPTKATKETNTGVKYITYEFQNMKPFARESGNRGPSYNYPHLLIQYNAAQEGDKKEPLTGNINGLYSWYYNLVKQLQNDTAELKVFTEKLIAGKTSKEEQMKAIYYWVQDNIRYIAFEDGIAGFKPEECKDVFENRYGDCKGMANLLVNMLKIAGFDARHVWIGTRHLNYDYSTPSLAVDNHMIAAVKWDTGFIFLDGTETYCPLGEYAHRIQGRQVLIADGEKFVLSRVPEYGPEFNLTETKISITLNDKIMNAHVDQTMHGESRLDFIRSIHSLRTQKRDHALYSYIGSNNISLTPTNIQTSSIDAREGIGTLSYDLKVEDHIVRNGDKLYLNLDWEKDFIGASLDTGRRTDLDFHQKTCIKSETSVQLGGLKAMHIPSEVFEENDYYRVVLRMVESGNTLYYRKEIILKKGYLPTSEFKRWNALNLKMKAFYQDYVVLK
ncbi:MAG: transglutaminase-like domain-containing protein [Bacteroidota bacterium]|jgi:hypothetical protein